MMYRFLMLCTACALSISGTAMAGDGRDEPPGFIFPAPSDSLIPSLEGNFGPLGGTGDPPGLFYRGDSPAPIILESDFQGFARSGQWTTAIKLLEDSPFDRIEDIDLLSGTDILRPLAQTDKKLRTYRPVGAWGEAGLSVNEVRELRALIGGADEILSDPSLRPTGPGGPLLVFEPTEELTLRPAPPDIFSSNPSPRDGTIVGLSRSHVVTAPGGRLYVVEVSVGASETFFQSLPPDTGPPGPPLETNNSAYMESYLECPIAAPGPGEFALIVPAAQPGMCAGVITVQETPVVPPVSDDGFEAGDYTAWSNFQATR